ncbi:MAG: HAD-IC family P-type ATPase [Clostridia bacterium]|nr:HAD-IC family P-type ATPase [Clostridia bacterium]
MEKTEIAAARQSENGVLGLTTEEVERERALGHVNVSREKVGKSTGRIICENLLTFFNLVWAIVAVVLISIGSVTNLTFLFIIIPNVLIAIIQEIRAKKTVEKLSVTTDPKAEVIRNGELIEIAVEDIVLGDVMRIEMGKQVLSDGIVLSGLAEANESMLTGESDAIKKTEGDTVLAGSYLVSGSILVKVIRVGEDNYVHKIEKAAKGFKKPASNLFRDMNRLIKYIGIMLVPMAIICFISNYFFYLGEGESMKVVIEKTCGSVIGMIPAGIYLLVTITLTLSVISLSKKRTLVQDMYSIEMLASADVVCLDKTGTITDGTMCVTSFRTLDGTPEDEIRKIMAAIEGAENSINNTSRALIDCFGREEREVSDKLPFSSERKYSAVAFSDGGVYAIGAPHFVPCPVSDEVEREIKRHAKEGERVLLLARLDSLDSKGSAVALIAISDRIRPNAKETIEKFQSQGVTVKIISGDHAATVSTIAQRVGVKNAERYISCESLSDEELIKAADKYAIFGRVTPEQKVLLVKTLKANGHTVAMTGDGVNDTLALKESNCAIAMADGSEMARKVSQIVLLDSDFGTLPDVVREGRRCINNVRMSAVLFLMKTVFTICLSLFVVFAGTGYPFEPKQFLLLELFVIGIASVLLALEPNNKRIEGDFLKTVLVKSVPNALVMFLPVLLILLIGGSRFGIDSASRNSIATVVVTLIGYINLVALCIPYTKWRRGVVIFIGGAIVAVSGISLLLGFISPALYDLLMLVPAVDNLLFFLGMVGVSVALSLLLQLFRPQMEKGIFKLVDKCEQLFSGIREKLAERKNNKKA